MAADDKLAEELARVIHDALVGFQYGQHGDLMCNASRAGLIAGLAVEQWLHESSPLIPGGSISPSGSAAGREVTP
jgi:hypothetical protein